MVFKKYKNLIFKLFFIAILVGGLSFFSLSSVHAAQPVDLGVDQVGKATGLPSNDIRIVIAQIIRVALGFLGIVAVVIIIYGGYIWMTAGGDESKIEQAKKILTNAAIGLAIILSAYAITSYIISSLLKATSGGSLPEHCYNGTKDADETNVDCGGSCGSCGGIDQPSFPGGNVFYVSSLPPAGEACIRNVHLVVVFNKDVDISTMNDNVVVHKKTGEAVKGVWKYGDEKNVAVFIPEGSCGGDGGNDCLEPNTAHTLEFKNTNAIKTLDGLLTLNCTIKAGCGPVDFTSGSGVDRQAPTVKIIAPADKSSAAAGSAVPVKVEFTDDSGLQSIAVYQDNTLISSQSLPGCKKSGTVDMTWSTTGLKAGSYTLGALALDWAAQKGEAKAQINLLPFHCYNDTLETDLGEKEKGPPACGGECGSCGGESCSDGSQCASGYCDKSGGGNKGVCLDKTRIDAVSPLSGAPGSYVSIQGTYFGDNPGEVYFSKVPNPTPENKTDWVKAQLVNCGGATGGWSTSQVIVEVPVGAVNGPLMLATGQIVGRDKVSRQFTDLTNDNWGPKINDFKITTEIRPGLCSVVPDKGVSGDAIQLIGKNFGLLDNNKDYVVFGEELKAAIIGNAWSDSSIKATVPYLDQGIVGIRVVSNGVESNGVRFIINSGESADNPLISSITPNRGAGGEYITITGKNFGSNIGAVWFKTSADSEAIIGDFTFPASCQKGTWRDDQIIVKFPKGKGDIGKEYHVQVKTADSKLTRFDTNLSFTLADGEPAPGICNISPISGPVPFPEEETVTLSGEYFGTSPDVYFWKVGANAAMIDGRVVVPKAGIVSANNTSIVLHPPANFATGPVVVYKDADKKISNPVQFTILDCVKNNNKCSSAGAVCCAQGKEQGVCKPANELCEGSTRFAGYVWRFSTGDIPIIPQVVERCDDGTDQGKNLPTPAPSIQWDDVNPNGDHHNVCRNAVVTTEFTTPIDQSTVNAGTVSVNKCSGVDKNNCTNPTPIKLTLDSYNLKVARGETGGQTRSYLSMSPEGIKWEDNTWYQVIFSTGIKSSGKVALPLSVDRPCSNRTDAAYCFVFKTDTKDCRMKAVVVTPYSYWTSVLEEPIKFRAGADAQSDLLYYGNGLSDQHCVMMDTSGFNWSWVSGNKNYAAIYGEATGRSVKASALANTVAIGLTNPDNAVNISATAESGGRSFTGNSPLTIDLSDPEVVDYWPKCLEACTNAEVAVRFNTTMSLKNLPGAEVKGTVQLLKCNDENCLSTVSVVSLNDVVLDQSSNYTVLKLANSTENSSLLEPNTIYQVVLSATSSNPTSALNQLWSSGTFRNPRSWSKPYNQVFTWRFKTKKDRCSIDRVDVTPPTYYATSIKEKVVYNVGAYSSPDACSKEGQKLDPWQVNWSWTSSDPKVAAVTTFNTKGKNQFCTNDCVRKGSDIPAGKAVYPVCGNGKIEAGEDCDAPDKGKGCGLNCLYLGNTAPTCGNGVVEANLGEACDPKDPNSSIGCSKDCRHSGSSVATGASEVNASICGNGMIGSGEDCDSGIAGDPAKSSSALNCTEKCVHTGTKLSSSWCFDNRLAHGGFPAAEYEAACQLSFSQCGDKIQSPDEDPGCDNSDTGWDSKACTEYCTKIQDTECAANTEGCDELGRHKGSSLKYSTPSVCGDGAVGLGEDAFCESALSTKHAGLIDPWSLVTGVGLGTPAGEPPAQSSNIKALTTQQTKGGPVSDEGKFIISCGYKDDSECKEVFGEGYGAGEDSCCYAKPKLISTYPVNNTTNACPNTYLEAVFDTAIDPNSVKDNVVIARGSNDCKDAEDVTSLVAQASGSELPKDMPWYKRMWVAVGEFFAHLFGTEVSAAPTKWCVAPDVGKAEVLPVSDVNSTTARVVINLTAPLAFDSDYAIILKNDMKTVQGVKIGRAAKPLSWKFSTISTICELTGLEVDPAQHSFSRAGATTTVVAKAKTNNGSFIQGIPNFYDWEYVWGPTNPFVTLLNTTSSVNTVTAQNRNGEIDVRVSANITDNKYSNTKGLAATGKSHMIVFLCENPWPPKDLYLGASGPYTIFPFEDTANNNDGFDVASNTFNNTRIPPSAITTDGYFNFSTYYCADSGSPGTFDDLPYLRGTVQVTSSVITTTSSLKRFFFTNTQNSDAIGVQVFANPKHLTVKEWYAKSKEAGGQGFVGEIQDVKVNGYNAITDGSNVYVDALNYSNITKNVYSTIYLFSINSDAKQETRKVFEDLVKNLKFNVNLTNYGYCGASADNPNFVTTCKTDLDCKNGEVCSATVDKLRRNYQRLRDLSYIQANLRGFADANNTYPDLKEGTFLKGQTLSVWPSWSELNNATGNTFPSDPVNLLGTAGTCATSTNIFCTNDGNCPAGQKCVLHEASTGWSTDNRRFSFACATSSYAYRYIYTPGTTTGYMVRTHLEQPGVTINNQTSLIKDFVDTSHFVVDSPFGICNQDQEISTLNQGVCGDGQVNQNKGEECDPPGRTRFGQCDIATDKIKVDVCNAACKWTPSSTPQVACSYLSKCGNGIVETGETCDDGKMNGRYNHCTKDCKWPPPADPGYCGDGTIQNAYEICDTNANVTGKKGICATGLSWGTPCDNDTECTQKDAKTFRLLGTCKTVEESKVRYGKQKAESCNWDCQSTGPYCGDGIVQAEFGEECEGNQACAINGAKGNKYCTKECKLADASPIGWWSFEDAEKETGLHGLKIIHTTTFFDKMKAGHNASCVDEDCPEFVNDGKSGPAVSFNGKNRLTVNANNGLMPLMTLSVEAWIKPTAFNSDWMRVLEKGGYKQSGGGYGLQFNPSSHLGFTVWGADEDKPSMEVYSKDPIRLNEWTHVVGTFERKGAGQVLKIYINGVLDNILSQASVTPLLTNSTRNLVIGRSSVGGDAFKGYIDEVKVYDRVVAPAEILDRFTNNWACSLTSTPSGLIGAGGSCGDGKVDGGEACDRGADNGLACTPKYGESCTYCAGDCKNVIDVQSNEYCGNGKVEGPEACDTDLETNAIYSFSSNAGTSPNKDDAHQGYPLLSCAEEPQTPSSLKKGTKSCVNKCLAIQSACVKCGALAEGEKGGTQVWGSIVDTVDPTSTNPLEGGAVVIPGDPRLFFKDSVIDLLIEDKVVGHVAWLLGSDNLYSIKSADEDAYATSSAPAVVNSDSKCSFGDGSTYALRINEDNGHLVKFPVLSGAPSWQYDLIVSPVIPKDTRPDHIRVVTTWVNSTPNLYSGFIIPVVGLDSTIEQTTPPSNGSRYFDKPDLNGIWYHGFAYTGTKTNVRSFTIDTAKMIDDQYVFYVRIPQTKLTDPGIYRYKDTAHLKVDIYVSETDGTSNHFGLPVKTFYLNNAEASDNPNAPYWYVFNLKRDPRLNPEDRIIPVNKIITKMRVI